MTNFEYDENKFERRQMQMRTLSHP